MKSKKLRIFDSYEIEIKISLILLIAFLLSLNFLSSFAMNRARMALREKSQELLNLTLSSVKSAIENDDYNIPDPQLLKRFALAAGVDRIEISDSLGNQLLAITTAPDPGHNKISKLRSSAVVLNKLGNKLYSIEITGSDREDTALSRLALLDTIFRGFGLIAGLAVAALFIRFVMNPFRKMRSQARDLDINIRKISSADSVEYVVTMFQEIIAQLKQKEETLRRLYDDSERKAESLERYNEYILGSISTGVIICDNSGKITRFNRSAKKITGFENVGENGVNLAQAFGKNHQITKLMNEALRGITYSRRELEMTRPDGSRQWIGLSTSQISDDRDNRLGAAILLTDLTKIKQMQALIDYQEKMSALGQISSGLAHELRNSVAAIVGFAKLLKKSDIDDMSKAIVENILSESMATEQMLSRFVDFARPIKLLPEPVDLVKALKESADQCIAALDNSKIEIAITSDSDKATVEADPVLLKNAFRNLILNSCQAIDGNGKIAIEINLDSDNNRYIVKIIDDGPGIDPKSLPLIFNPFFTTKEKGTGLGLAIVKKIISAHFGEIEIDSRPGKTTAIVSLPIKQTVHPEAITSRESLVPELKDSEFSNVVR